MPRLTVIAHNMRSVLNVGALLRTAEGLGVDKVYLTGYTPHPQYPGDPRLPHVSAKQSSRINKTALGAEENIAWEYAEDVINLISILKEKGNTIVALEQSKSSVKLPEYHPKGKIVLVLGEEVAGIQPAVLKLCHEIIEIPMHGHKESFNVVEAASMALYHCKFIK